MATIFSLSPFSCWGLLSIGEVELAIQRLGLKAGIVTGLTCVEPKFHGSFLFILHDGHWTCLVNIHNRIYAFDPLGNGKHVKRFSRAQATQLGIRVQPESSILCGNYCLLFAHAIRQHCTCFHPDLSASAVCGMIRTVLSNYLNIFPEPLGLNEMLAQYFTADYNLGEEWQYQKFLAYNTVLKKGVAKISL